jgi:hypothetical protein
MANVKQGAKTAESNRKAAGPKVAKIIKDEQKAVEHYVSYISKEGADGAWVIPSGPKYNAATGVQIGWEEGIHLDFRGVGVTAPYDLRNPVHKQIVAKIDELIKEGWPIVGDLGLERLAPDAPRPLFAKWDKLSPAALKVALAAVLGDDHDENVRVIKECARYEIANENREAVLAVLDSFIALEAAESDEFDVTVEVGARA